MFMSEFGREFPGANAQTELTNVGSTEAPLAYDADYESVVADYANASLISEDELSELPIIVPDEVEQAHVEAPPASGSLMMRTPTDRPMRVRMMVGMEGIGTLSAQATAMVYQHMCLIQDLIGSSLPV